MQTFLPYADFVASAGVLDDRRLGKQRVETFQILRALVFPAYAWKNHPAVRMWRGFLPALVAYGLAACAEWRERGFADSVAGSLLEFSGGVPPDVAQLRVRGQLPPWLGLGPLHLSHRSALVRKFPEHYREFFPDVPADLPYVWPSATFPRWPVRRRSGMGLPLAVAVGALGLDAPRPGQQEAVAALRAGRDVLLTMPAGYGGSTTGLLAGLTSDRPTLWVTPATGDMPADGPPRQPVRRRGQRQVESYGAMLTARPPTEADLAEVAAEVAAEPDFVFLRPAALADPATATHLAATRPGVIVVDDVGRLTEADGAAISSAVRDLGAPPLLAVAGPAQPERRAEIAALLGLSDPVLAGGGFDRPATWLGVRLTGAGGLRGQALAQLVQAADGPGLVVVPDRARAQRVAAALVRRRVRVGVATAAMRPARLAATLTAYRSGRLDVLVVTPDADLDIGRARVHFVHFAGPPADLDALHGVLGLASRQGERSSSVLLLTANELGEVTGPGAPAREALGRYAAGEGCRRVLLLDFYGEPVAVPCRRCDRCAPDAEPGRH